MFEGKVHKTKGPEASLSVLNTIVLVSAGLIYILANITLQMLAAMNRWQTSLQRLYRHDVKDRKS